MRRARCGMIVAAAVLFAGALLVRSAATDGTPRATAQKFRDEPLSSFSAARAD